MFQWCGLYARDRMFIYLFDFETKLRKINRVKNRQGFRVGKIIKCKFKGFLKNFNNMNVEYLCGIF